MRPLARIFGAGVLVAAVGCGAEDPFPGRPDVEAPQVVADGLLDRPELQAVVDLELRRDGAALRALFESPDAAVRARAARAMASVRDPGAAPELRALLGDPEPRVREAAAFALAHYAGAGDGGEQMGELLARERDPRVRAALIDALGKAGYSRTLHVLLGLDGADRAAATLAISRAVIRGAPPAAGLDSLVARMADPDPEIRRNAAYFMERVDADLWIDHRGDIRGALDAMPLDDPAAMSIVAGLGRRFDVFSLPRILLRARFASDWRVRANAMAALDGMGQGEERLRTLLDGLLDPSPHVRALAGGSLASAPPAPDVQAWLANWVENHPEDLSGLGPVLLLLGRAGDQAAVLGWSASLDLDDEAGWSVAIPALAETPAQQAVEELLRAAGSPHAGVSRPAAAALVARAETASGFGAEPVLVDLLGRGVEEADPGVVPRLAAALAGPELAGAGGIERLEAAWRSVGGPEADARRRGVERALADVGALDALARLGVQPPEADAPGEGGPSAGGAAGAAARSYPAVDWEELADWGDRPRLVFETERGTIVLELAADQAPRTVQTILALAREGRFDGVPFHRVVPNFVIQGGDLSRGAAPRPAAPRLRTEITPIPFERGVVGMANTGSLDTESSQFFITHDRKPHLDGGYTAFGWVVQGMDVVDLIEPYDRILRARVARTF